MVPPFRIEEILNNEDGTDTVVMDLSDEFVSFFCDLKGIQEFDKELFNEWFLEAIQTAVDAHRNKENQGNGDNEIPNR
jgi:hypothetical protein